METAIDEDWSDWLQFVMHVDCKFELLGLIEPPENEPPRCPNHHPPTLFLLDIKVYHKRVVYHEEDAVFIDAVFPRVLVNQISSIDIDLHGCPRSETLLLETLRQLRTPTVVHDDTVELIMYEAAKTAEITGATTKRMHVAVDLVFDLLDHSEEEDANHGVYYYDEPRFVPASTSSISKLKRKRVGVESEVCAVCLDEMTVGIEATTMPCGHFYHEACIVGWLKQSGVCPLCKFRMPKNEDGELHELG